MESREIIHLLTELRKAQVVLQLKENQLLCHLPKQGITASLKKRLIDHKDDLKQYFSDQLKISKNKGKAQKNSTFINFLHNTPLSKTDLVLSSEQMRLWYLEEVQDKGTANHMPLHIFDIKGDVNLKHFQQAMHELSQRHDTLRTVFVVKQGGNVVSNVLNHDLHQLIYVELNDDSQQWPNIVERERQRRFSLSDGPMFQVSLYKRAESHFGLMIAMHHIISDGWSMNILVGELAEIYNGLCQGLPSRLLPLSIQYQQYADAQQQWLSSTEGKKQLDYWQKQLADMAPLALLPTDFIRTGVNETTVETIKSYIDNNKVTQLNLLCQQLSCTRFVVLLATFKLLASRLTGCDDLLIGCANGNRHAPEFQSLIGCFINHLLVRSRLDADTTIRQFIKQVNNVTLDALDHQMVPYDDIVHIVDKYQSAEESGLFNLYFNYLNYPADEQGLHNLEITNASDDENISKFDITLYVENVGSSISIEFNYNAALFKQQRMVLFLDYFMQIFDAIINCLDLPMAQLNLTKGNWQQCSEDSLVLKDQWKGSIISVLEHNQPIDKNKIMIVADEDVISHELLTNMTDQLAIKLIGSGLATNSVVAIFAQRDFHIIPAIMAIIKSGMIFCIIPLDQSEQLTLEQLQSINVNAVIGAINDQWQSPSLLRLIKSLPVFSVDRQITSINKGLLTPPAIQKDDLAYIAFTSGTSGIPKMIKGGHKSWPVMLQHLINQVDVNQYDRFAMLSGLQHDPLHRDIFLPLLLGACICIPKNVNYDGGSLRRWLLDQKITVINVTPSFARLIMEGYDNQNISLKKIICAGEALSSTLARKLMDFAPQAQLYNLYGSTETQQAVSCLKVEEKHIRDHSYIPIASQSSGLVVKVVNKKMQPCVMGEVGDLVMYSYYMSPGYMNSEKDNGFGYDRQTPYYKTGDIGRYHLDGSIEYIGRMDRQIKLRGHRIELSEIEFQINKQKQVSSSVVVASKHKQMNTIAAYIKFNDNFEITLDQLKRNVNKLLPQYKRPAQYIRIDEWPLTQNGKIDIKVLEKMDSNMDLQEIKLPENDTQKTLQSIWSELLSVDAENISIDAGFFELGGHSLLVTKLFVRIKKTFEVELDYKVFFKNNSIKKLAHNIKEHQLINNITKTKKKKKSMTI